MYRGSVVLYNRNEFWSNTSCKIRTADPSNKISPCLGYLINKQKNPPITADFILFLPVADIAIGFIQPVKFNTNCF